MNTVIQATAERFAQDPAAAQSSPSVNARVVDGRAELTAGQQTWYADLPLSLGGTNGAPSPTAYLLGALVGCAVAFLHDTLGPQMGIRIDDVGAVARCRTDARGLLGMDSVAPDLADIELEIWIASPDPEDRVQELYRTWLERCPIYLALAKPMPISARLVTGARQAATV
jgi:uncharacterized OsmC-like protein